MNQEQEIIKNLQKETIKHNKLAKMALFYDRDYITPEDVKDALDACKNGKVIYKINY